MERITVAELPGDFPPEDAIRLVRYLRDELTSQERIDVERWIAETPDRQALVTQLAALWRAVPLRPKGDYDIEAALLRAKQGVSNQEKRPPRLAARFVRARTHSLVYGLAAAAAVIVVGVYQYARPAATEGRESSKTYTTQTARQATIELGDGSRMRLAPNTRATVVVTADARTVTLSGEAHFDVVPNPRIAFIVRTGAATTRVLGTTFDVRRYADESVGEIVVHAGKVMTSGDARHGGQSVILTAGMAARFTDSVPAVVSADAMTTTDWAHGQLVFRGAPVPEVLATLKRWYGYDFRLTDSALAERHITAVFLMSDSADMLRIVQRVLGVSMTFEDSVITLRPSRNRAVKVPARIHIRDAFPTLQEVGR